MASAIYSNTTEPLVQSIAEASPGKRELRVLQVFDTLGMGGAETWLMSLLRYFQEKQEQGGRKVSIDILLTGGEKAIFDDEAEALGARLFYLPFQRNDLVGFAREFRKILLKGNYDAIHDHQDYIAGLHFLMGGRYLPSVRVAHVHNPLYHRTNYAKDTSKRIAVRAGKYLLGRYATHVLGTSQQIVSEYGFDDFARRGIKLGAAHCGFDVTQYRGSYDEYHASICREFGWDESAKVILFVGRLDGSQFLHNGQEMSHKNPAFALEIAIECLARDPSVRLLMVGAGDTTKVELEAKVKSQNLESMIRLPGARADVPRLMLGSDLLLFPSLAEGLGMVVVEAQAAGLRTLASDTTPRESVVNPELVTFFSLEKGPGDWAVESLKLLSLDQPEREAANRHAQLSPFSIQNSANRLIDIYRGGLV